MITNIVYYIIYNNYTWALLQSFFLFTLTQLINVYVVISYWAFLKQYVGPIAHYVVTIIFHVR